MRCKKKIIAYAALCFLFLSMLLPMPVAAAEAVDTEKDCTLNIRFMYTDFPLAGAQFHVYKVGTIDSTGACALSGAFADDPVSTGLLTSSGMAEAAELLYGYALLDQVQPDAVLTVGQNGGVSRQFPVGLYLIAGQKLERSGGIIRSAPMLVSLPYRFYEDEPWSYQVTVNPKSTFIPQERIGKMNRSVMKVWQDGESEDRPKSVKVHLLRDNAVFDTVELSSENRWLHRWEDLDEHYDWRIVEEPVAGYTVKTGTLLNVFLLTNTAVEDPTETTAPSEPDLPVTPDETTETTAPSDPSETTAPSGSTESTAPSGSTETTDPSESTVPTESSKPEETTKPTQSKPDKPKLPQTGMVWWPVPVLLLLGAILIVLGIKVRRGDRDA